MAAVKPKPLFGDACNNCGLCCLLGPCGAARAILGVERGTCPALRPNGLDGFLCGLATAVQSPVVREAVAIATGAGIGCDMADTAEDVAARAERVPVMREAARKARREASPGAEALLRAWRLAPP